MEFIIIVTIAIAVVSLLYYIASLLPSQSETRGLRGERKVFSILKELPDEYYIWNDIVLQRNGYSVQIDHIVISPYGIFVIETKNFKGWIYGQDKIDILQNSDLFLLPSLIEPFGFCILEAMKAGLPIVSFNTEGPEDIITNKFGRLVKISTNYDTMAKDFGNAIIDIIQDENFNELRKASAEAIKNWDIKKLIEFIIEQ